MILLLALAMLVPSGDPSVDDALEQARVVLEQGRTEDALAILAPHAVEHAPLVGALYLEACRRAQRFENARAYIGKVEDRAPESSDLVIAIAQWEAEEGWVHRATESLDAAILRDPANDALWAARARLSWSLGGAVEALSAADTAVTHGADPLELDWIRGQAQLQLGRSEAAEETLSSLVEKRPGHLGARLILARTARARGEHATAILGLWEILELDPDHAAALGELGSLLVREKATRERGVRALERFRILRDRRERIERLTRERREGRDTEATRAELVALLRADGRPALAVPVGTACAEGSPGRIEQARAWIDLGRSGMALPILAAALRNDPTRDDLRLELAETLLLRGDAAAARAVLTRTGPNVDPIRRVLAEVECTARLEPDPELIIPPLVALVLADPANLDPVRAAVDAAIAFGRDEALANDLRSLRVDDPGALAPLLGLAWLTLEAGDGNLGSLRGELETAGETSPDAWICLARAARLRGDESGEESAFREARRTRALVVRTPIPQPSEDADVDVDSRVPPG